MEMTDQEKLGLLEEIMDVEPGTLHLTDELAGFEEWDSLTILTYITTMEEKFKKTIEGEEIKGFVVVADALRPME